MMINKLFGQLGKMSAAIRIANPFLLGEHQNIRTRTMLQLALLLAEETQVAVIYVDLWIINKYINKYNDSKGVKVLKF